jgi:hypothetical protein
MIRMIVFLRSGHGSRTTATTTPTPASAPTTPASPTPILGIMPHQIWQTASVLGLGASMLSVASLIFQGFQLGISAPIAAMLAFMKRARRSARLGGGAAGTACGSRGALDGHQPPSGAHGSVFDSKLWEFEGYVEGKCGGLTHHRI